MAGHIIGFFGEGKAGKSSLISALSRQGEYEHYPKHEKELMADLDLTKIYLPSGEVCGVAEANNPDDIFKGFSVGTGGFKFAILSVDVADGVTANIKKQIEILRLLGIRAGLAVITKTDRPARNKVEDVVDDLKRETKGTFLDKFPIMKVSAHTGEGIQELLNEIDNAIRFVPQEDEDVPFRMAADRAFMRAGYGTVVVGTIYQGTVKVEKLLQIMPLGKKVKIKKIQVFDAYPDETGSGVRAAINISKLEPENIKRGDTLCAMNAFQSTGRVEAYIETAKTSAGSIKNSEQVEVVVGTGIFTGKLFILDKDEIENGSSGYVRINFDSPTVMLPGDRFIVRAVTNKERWGGGKSLDPHPARHRRFDKTVLEMLDLKNKGDLESLLEKLMDREPYIVYNQETLAASSSLSLQEAGELLREMAEKNKLHYMSLGRLILKKTLEQLSNKVISTLEFMQKAQPNKLGRKFDEIRRNMPEMEDRLFRELIIHLKSVEKIREKNGLISTAGFEPELTSEQKECYGQIKEIFGKSGFKPPTRQELVKVLTCDRQNINCVIDYMLYKGDIVALDEKILFEGSRVAEARKIIGSHILQNGAISPADAALLLESTRKYVIPLLEYFDKTYFTKRKGNNRVLFKENVYVEK